MFKRNTAAVFFALATFTIQFAFPSVLYASLNEVTTAFGAGTGTQDTVSNRIWLDLSRTRPLSYNQVASLLATDPLYAGFNVASGLDVSQLINNSGLLTASATTAFDAFNSVVTLLGGSVEDIGGNGCALAVYGLVGGAGPEHGVNGFLNDRGPPRVGDGCGAADTTSVNLENFAGGFAWPDTDPIADSSSIILSGVWLFREGERVPVPVPGTLALVIAGLAASRRTLTQRMVRIARGSTLAQTLTLEVAGLRANLPVDTRWLWVSASPYFHD